METEIELDNCKFNFGQQFRYNVQSAHLATQHCRVAYCPKIK